MLAPHTTATLADRWGVPRRQFRLRGEVPQEPVSFDAELGLWPAGPDAGERAWQVRRP